MQRDSGVFRLDVATTPLSAPGGLARKNGKLGGTTYRVREGRSLTDSRNGLAGSLGRQAHSLEKFAVSLVVAQIFKQRFGVERGQPGVSLFVGTFQPFK